MPLYEYACRECGGRFERMRKTAERLSAPACPTCTSGETMLRDVGDGSGGGFVGSRDLAGL